MTIKAGTALTLAQAAQKLSAVNYPAKDARRLGLLLALLRAHPEVIATEMARANSIRLHGKESPKDSGNYTVPPNMLGAFLADYAPVANKDIEMDLPRLPLSILERAPEMTPEEMAAMEPLWEPEPLAAVKE